MTVDEALDELYASRPEDFTALRKELVATARKRGDRDGAREIASARRPTTAAWVVNVLVRTDPSVKRRLGELTAELKAAHAAMDGTRIRELTAIQRALVQELVRSALAAAGLSDVTAALKDDVAGTLQAAIADADVAARLGRLEKAESWSGFGDFGAAAAVGGGRRAQSKPTSAEPAPAEQRVALAAARRRRAEAQKTVEAARMAHDRAVEEVTERRARVVGARRRYEQLLERLSAAEHDVDAADAELDASERDAEAAAERLADAVAELGRLTD